MGTFYWFLNCLLILLQSLPQCRILSHYSPSSIHLKYTGPSTQTSILWKSFFPLNSLLNYQKKDSDMSTLYQFFWPLISVQFSSLVQSYPTLCDPKYSNTPGLPVHHQFLEFTQTHVHWVGDAIQQSHPLSSPSPPAFYLFQHQGLFRWVSPSHQVAKVLEFQLQHQSFQWIFRTDFL